MLLTRLPLIPKDAFDLHVLSLPPAFALSQDQTLKLKSSISADHNITECSHQISVSTNPESVSET